MIALITILLVIWEAEEHMYVFGLRPSESISSDIAGLITLSRGLPGDFTLKFTNTTKEVLHNITIDGKLVCVTASSHYTATDCASFAINNFIGTERANGTGFELTIEKNGDVLDPITLTDWE